MHRILVAISLLFLTLACGNAPDFSGDYGARYLGQSVQLHLEQDGGELTGQVTYARVSGPLQATILAGKASGFVDAGLMGRFPFEAEMDGESGLRWKYLLALPGQTQALELDFERRPEVRDALQGSTQRDPALVGHWRRTLSNSVGGLLPRGNMNVATDIFCTLSGDGSFSFGGSRTGVASPEIAATTDRAEISNGEWKTEGGELYSRTSGEPGWASLGRYAVSGASLVLYAGNGKQLWERQ
ncbi:MAG: hypothetical protein JKY61_10720 [Planctomycetes bacterium]|nr:hypothetical protein [Planctomycetota bacterium]